MTKDTLKDLEDRLWEAADNLRAKFSTQLTRILHSGIGAHISSICMASVTACA